MWYYAQNNQQFGPFEETKIKELIDNGTINTTTLVWTAGMATWLPLSQTPLGGGLPVPPVPAYANVVVDPRVDELNKLFTWMWITLIGSLITFGISAIASITLFFIIVYKSWMLVQDGEARTTADQAVAFSFVPGFQFWWWFIAFKGLAKELNRVMAKKGIAAEPVNEELALWFVICCLASPLGIPAVAALVLGIILANQYKKASSAIILAGA